MVPATPCRTQTNKGKSGRFEYKSPTNYSCGRPPDETGDPFLQPSWEGGPQVFVAALLAAESVNNGSRLLEGFELMRVALDGACDISSKTAEAIARLVYWPPLGCHISTRSINSNGSGLPPVVGVIGPGCSASALLLTPITSRRAISLINLHIAATPLLSDPQQYPFGISMVGSAYCKTRNGLRNGIIPRNNLKGCGFL